MTQSTYTIESLRRGLHVLSLFSREQPTLTLSEIVQQSNLNKTTAFRIVSTLETAEYLSRDPQTRQYRPGLKVLQLGFTAVSSLEFRQVARPYLQQLSHKIGETVSMTVLDGMELIYIDRVRNHQIVGVVLGIGSRIPAHCASMGKAILAYLEDEELNGRLQAAPLTPCTAQTILSNEQLHADLAQVRQQGYAINDEELELGLRAVAAPIWSNNNQVVAAINITGSVHTISRQRLVEELAPKVVDTAVQISQALGYGGSSR